jgi:E3 ubiquitin-protein ligase makorin
MQRLTAADERRDAPECCSHAFCLACLQSWRSNTDSESRDAAKTCPLCRKRSRFITPSSRFFPDGAEKQALVDRYKRNMAKKECRCVRMSDDCW